MVLVPFAPECLYNFKGARPSLGAQQTSAQTVFKRENVDCKTTPGAVQKSGAVAPKTCFGVVTRLLKQAKGPSKTPRDEYSAPGHFFLADGPNSPCGAAALLRAKSRALPGNDLKQRCGASLPHYNWHFADGKLYLGNAGCTPKYSYRSSKKCKAGAMAPALFCRMLAYASPQVRVSPE